MADNAKKKVLRDILGELEKNEKPNLPVFDDSLVNFNNSDTAGGIEIPIPEEVVFDENKKTKPITIPKASTSSDSINTLEDIQQRTASLEDDNKKLKQLLSTQKKELEEYMSRLGVAEAENKKIKGELSNADSNARLNLEAQLNRASIIEEKYNKLAQTHEEMKTKVRQDIRKIGVREKELSNKLEIMRNDSETLLAAKDQKILQLKQHIDNLEFEIETLKEKVVSLQAVAKESEDKAERVIKALRLSTSLLEINPKKE